MKQNLIIVLISLTLSLSGQAVKKPLTKSPVLKAGSGYIFTEGPAVAPDGKVYFTDQPNDRIHVWDEKSGITLWLEGTGRSNGLYFNREGNLVACADLNNELVFFDKNKKLHLIHSGYNGKMLNAPNDLWIDPNGGIYFSDPFYARKYWKQGRTEEQEVRGVYYLSPGGKIQRVISDFVQPNGLIGTPDGKILYVADINDKKIWKYDILADGSLTNKTFFAPDGSDGMTIDNKGNVYITSGKVWVYSPAGALIQEIEVPEKPSNVCFGGKNRKTLFITARTSVYTVKMKVKGVS